LVIFSLAPESEASAFEDKRFIKLGLDTPAIFSGQVPSFQVFHIPNYSLIDVCDRAAKATQICARATVVLIGIIFVSCWVFSVHGLIQSDPAHET
jgi:hypothetical protein